MEHSVKLIVHGRGNAWPVPLGETHPFYDNTDYRDLANAAFYDSLKLDAVFLNTSRGAVMDTAVDEIPGAAVVAINEQGDTAIGTLGKYLLTHPGDLAGMIRTARRFQVAAGALRQACRLARDSLLLSH